MNRFFVGQQVVCIDDKFKTVSIDQGIREGQIYTLRWVGMYSHYVDGEFLGVKLVEVDRGNDGGLKATARRIGGTSMSWKIFIPLAVVALAIGIGAAEIQVRYGEQIAVYANSLTQ